MSRLDLGGTQITDISIEDFYGLNNSVQFSQIDIRQSPSLLNLIPSRIKGLRHRAGTYPVSLTPRAGGLVRLFPYYTAGLTDLVATGGTTLYKYDTVNKDWDAQTMTVPLVTADLNATQFRDEDGNEVLVIADGGDLKYYNGTAVNDVTPATNDPSPLPANDLATINTDFPPVGITTHTNRLVIWSADSDTIHHSKPGFYDYFPETSFQRFVNEADTIQTCISFGSSLLVFMRRHVGVLFGDGYSEVPQSTDWSQDFLDTQEGCCNPRSVRVVTFPDMHEETFYQTDRGVSAVINVDTKSLDNSTRIATLSRTENKVDWTQLGITRDQWENAISYVQDGKYWLVFEKGAGYAGLVFDTDNYEWYPIENVEATDFYGDSTGYYFIGEDGYLKIFDDNVHFDYTDPAKTTGPPVRWYWYSKLLSPGTTGYDHLWDILMVVCQQFTKTSTIDVAVNTNRQGGSNISVDNVLQSEIMIIGQSVIGLGVIANQLLTDFITVEERLDVFISGKYAQIKLFSDRGDPVELYKVVMELRPQAQQIN